MKKISLVILMALFAVAANAQLVRNNFFLGGSLGFSSFKTTDKVGGTSMEPYKRTSFNITPRIGYFIANRTALGVSMGFTSTETVITQPDNDKTTTTETPINAGLFLRRYMMVTETFGFIGEVAVNGYFGSGKTENYDFPSGITITRETSISGFDAMLNGGIFWFASPHVGIEATTGVLGFRSIKTKFENTNPEETSTDSEVMFGINTFQLNLGFHYYFF